MIHFFAKNDIIFPWPAFPAFFAPFAAGAAFSAAAAGLLFCCAGGRCICWIKNIDIDTDVYLGAGHSVFQSTDESLRANLVEIASLENFEATGLVIA